MSEDYYACEAISARAELEYNIVKLLDEYESKYSGLRVTDVQLVNVFARQHKVIVNVKLDY